MSSPKVYSPLGSAASIPMRDDDLVAVQVREEKNTPRHAHLVTATTNTNTNNTNTNTTTATNTAATRSFKFKDSGNDKGGGNGGMNESISTTGGWRNRVAPSRRSQFFWLVGALLAIIWTVAIFARAVDVSKYVYCNGVTCWNGKSSYAATTLGWVVLAFSLVGVIAGFVIAFQYSDRSVGAWFRLREHDTIRKRSTRNSTTNINGDIENGNGRSNDISVDPMLSPRYEQSKDNVGRSILLAFVPFGIAFTIIGIWFGFHIGAVAALLSVDVSTIEKWAFSMCVFAMLFITPIVIILSWMDRLHVVLGKMDDALIDWSTNDGLAPLGKFAAGIVRGIAISGWFALLGVLIGTCIGLPAQLMGGIGLAILILALVIVIIAVWYFHKRFRSPSSTPAPQSSTIDDTSTQTHVVPSSTATTTAGVTAKPTSLSTPMATTISSKGENDSGGVPLQPVVTPMGTPMTPPVYETPHDPTQVSKPMNGSHSHSQYSHGVKSPHNDNGNDNGAVLIHTNNVNANVATNPHGHGSNDGEVLYLRGLSLLNDSNGNGNGANAAAASSLIMKSAEMGYAPAQEHLRQLLMKQSTPTTSASSMAPTKTI